MWSACTCKIFTLYKLAGFKHFVEVQQAFLFSSAHGGTLTVVFGAAQQQFATLRFCRKVYLFWWFPECNHETLREEKFF